MIKLIFHVLENSAMFEDESSIALTIDYMRNYLQCYGFVMHVVLFRNNKNAHNIHFLLELFLHVLNVHLNRKATENLCRGGCLEDIFV